MMVRTMLVCAVLMLGVLPGEATPPQFKITIENGAPYYLPAAATVAYGTPVRWDNPTATHHTVTHDGCLNGGTCLFASGPVSPNGSYILPDLPSGQYPYHCQLHPIMHGLLTITDPVRTPNKT